MKNNQFIRIKIFAVLTLLLTVYTYSSKTRANLLSQLPTQSGNLLNNGNMDEGQFYSRPTNHYVAKQWYEWWIDWDLPEFIDGGIIYHNECYPKPPDGLCYNDDTQIYNRSQGYIRFGVPYIAGIYQPVNNVEPCTLYRFEMWNRNDGDGDIAKIGIDPTGWMTTKLSGISPDNCPPDGLSPCPDPFIWGEENIPATIIWSEEYPQPAFEWGSGSVTVEVVSTTLTVWTYAAPEPKISLSTYWDYGSLVQIPFPDDRMPGPESWTSTGFISSVAASVEDSAVNISWNTTEPASSQVWYMISPPSIDLTTTHDLTYTLLMPVTPKSVNPEMYGNITPLKTTLTTQHHAVISGLNEGDILSFVPLSRHPISNTCITESDEPYRVLVNFP